MKDVSLSVVPDGTTAVGSVLRTNQAYLELLATKTTLDWGIAFCCTRVPGHRDGNQFREVWIESPAQMAEAFAAADAQFECNGQRCARWALAEAQPADNVEAFLTAHGYRREDQRALALAAWPPPQPSEGVRVLPARPMRAAFEACWHEAAAYLPDGARAAAVAAALERLDDHRMDAVVALVDGQPAGVGALFQVGDVARLVDVFVNKSLRRRGVGRAITAHLLALARRLSMRMVCAETSARNSAALAFLERGGFVPGGDIVEFLREDAAWPDFATW